jgi:hypothetical protein
MKKLLLSALALTVSAGLVGTSAPAYADPITAPAGADPAPAADAAAYLAAQPGPSGIIQTYYSYEGETDNYPDHGLTIDAAWALDAVGGQAAALQTMTQALEDGIGDYAFGGGSKSKISAYLLSQGVASAEVLAVVADIEANHLGDAAPIVGRLVDADIPETPYDDDFNSPLTQAFAVSALNNAGSDDANAALGYLLDQQCEEGFFASSFAAKDAVDQTCDGAASPVASVDTTATAVLMLQDQRSKPVVRAAVTAALDWLEGQQGADGSFSDGNANATGLAGWVLGLDGRTAQAAKAASWLRGQQLANAGSCTAYAAAQDGAVTLDSLGLANATDGFDEIENSSAARATTQALPALLWAPGGADAGAFTLSGATGFKPAGSAQQYTVRGAPGDTVCVTGAGAPTAVVLGAAGTGTATVTLPATTSSVSVSATDAGGETHALSVTALAKAKLGVKLKKSVVAKGKKVVVTVSGLAPGETVKVTLNGAKAKATAKPNGKAKVKIAAKKLGKSKVKAFGEFKNRRGKATVTVTR